MKPKPASLSLHLWSRLKDTESVLEADVTKTRRGGWEAGGLQLTEILLLFDQSLVQLQTVRPYGSARHLHGIENANVEPVLRAEQEPDYAPASFLGPSSRRDSGVVI